jgi:3-hydroxyacyl-CoA dehydrogenase
MDWPPETSAIEVMGTKGTNPEIIPLLMKECKEHGFNPFHVKKDSSGYIYNR